MTQPYSQECITNEYTNSTCVYGTESCTSDHYATWVSKQHCAHTDFEELAWYQSLEIRELKQKTIEQENIIHALENTLKALKDQEYDGC